MGPTSQTIFDQWPTSQPMLIVILICFLLLQIFSRFYLGNMRRMASTLMLALALLALWATKDRSVAGLLHRDGLYLLAAVVLVSLAAKLVVRLSLRWKAFMRLPAAERHAPVNWKTAMQPSDLIVIAGLIACVMYLRIANGWVMLSIVLALYLIVPFYQMLAQAETHKKMPQPEDESLVLEREKILTLLQDGKINAAEGVELLNALGTSRPAWSGPAPQPLSLTQKAMLAGAGLILIGFFLPWLSFVGRDFGGLSQELEKLISQTMQNPDIFNYHRPFLNAEISGAKWNSVSSWLILLGGIAAVGLAFMHRLLDRASRRGMTVVALALSSILAVYLIGSHVSYVSFGLVLVLLGLMCQWIGFARESPVQFQP